MSDFPYCYLAFKGKEFGGVIDSSIEDQSLHEFLIEMLEAGYTVKPLYHRDEYTSALVELNMA